MEGGGLFSRFFVTYIISTGITIEKIMDLKRNLSQRQISVFKINDNSLKAFCYLKNQRRIFKMGQILIILLINSRNKKIS